MALVLSELDILRDVAGTLTALGNDYMLTGSLAMSYYAQPRMTRDIDLVLALQHTDIERVVAAFTPAYYISRTEIGRAVTMRSMFNLIHTGSAIKIDCIVRKAGAYRELEFSRRRAVPIADFDIWIVSKEDLILSKLVWMSGSRSALQAADVRNLLETGYDRPYVEQWATELGVATTLRELSHA